MIMTHLDALELRLHNERSRLGLAKTDQERQMRRVWIAGIQKEIDSELAFLGRQSIELSLSDDELLAELSGE